MTIFDADPKKGRLADMIYSPSHLYQLSQMFPLPRHCVQNTPKNQKLGKPERTATSIWQACGTTCAVRRDGSMVRILCRNCVVPFLPMISVPSLKLTWHLKMDGWNPSFLLEPRPIFRCKTLNFRGAPARSRIEANGIHFNVAIAVN